MLDEKERLFDAEGKSFVITQNLHGKSLDGWVKQFKENEKFRLRKRKNSIYLNHEIISFHRDDTRYLSMKKLEQLVREYFRLRGNMLAVATVHYDRFHVHIHICSSAIEYRTGKSMRMSRKEFADLKKNIQQYQVEQFPELSRSVVRHGRKATGKITDKEIQLTQRTGKISKREQVRQIVQDCYQWASSAEEFYSLLKERGMDTYVRGGKVYGVVCAGMKYRFNLNSKGIEPIQLSKTINLNNVRINKEISNERGKV